MLWERALEGKPWQGYKCLRVLLRLVCFRRMKTDRKDHRAKICTARNNSAYWARESTRVQDGWVSVCWRQMQETFETFLRMAINITVQESEALNRSSEDHYVTCTHFQEKQPTDGNKCQKKPVQINQINKRCKQSQWNKLAWKWSWWNDQNYEHHMCLQPNVCWFWLQLWNFTSPGYV